MHGQGVLWSTALVAFMPIAFASAVLLLKRWRPGANVASALPLFIGTEEKGQRAFAVARWPYDKELAND